VIHLHPCLLGHLLGALAPIVALQAEGPSAADNLAFLEVQRTHASDIVDLCVTPDDRWLISTDVAESRVWDLASGRAVLRYGAPNARIDRTVGHSFFWSQQNALVIAGTANVYLLDPETLSEVAVLEGSAGCALFTDDAGKTLYRAGLWGDSKSGDGLSLRAVRLPEVPELPDHEKSPLVFSDGEFFQGNARTGGDFTRLGGNRFLFSSTDGTQHRVCKLGEWFEAEKPAPLGTGRVARGSDGRLYVFSIAFNGGKSIATIRRFSCETLELLDEGTIEVHGSRGALVPCSRDFLDRDGRLRLRTDTELLEVDMATLKLVARSSNQLAASFTHSAALHDGDGWIGAIGGRIVVSRGTEPPRDLAPELIPPAAVATSVSADEVLVGLWRVALTGGGVVARRVGYETAHSTQSADGRVLAYWVQHSHRVHVQTPSTSEGSVADGKERLLPAQDLKYPIERAVLSSSGRWLVLHMRQVVGLMDVASGELVWTSSPMGQGAPLWSPAALAVSPDEHRAAIVFQDGYDWHVRMLDLDTRQVVWSVTEETEPLELRFYGNEVLCVVSNPKAGLTAVMRDVRTSHEVLTSKLTLSSFNADVPRALSRDGEYFASLRYGRLVVWDMATGAEVFGTPTREQVAGIGFLRDSRFVVLSLKSGLLELWDLEAKRPVAAIAVFRDREWIVTGDDARFSASAHAADRVSLIQNGRQLPLESYYERFHTPSLVGELLALVPPTPRPALPVLGLPPTLSLAQEGPERGPGEVQLTARAKRGGAPIAEVRLFHNGKLVEQSTRGLTVEDDELDVGESLHRWTVALLPGENRFQAVAIDSARTESRPSEISLTGAIAATAPRGIQLHVVVVGINRYRNPKYNLNYALDDARAFRERLTERSAGIVSGVQVHELYDQDATKAGIVSALDAVQRAASKSDVFVFYYAGHGVMSSEEKPRFYLVPHEVTQLYGNDEALARLALSGDELRELSRLIPAQKQLFLLDACQSAGVLDAIAARGAAEEKAIAQLARATGTHWLTASGSEQFASEVKSLGHGVFTYVLLQALDGAADSGDGRVTVNELKAYVEAQVPEVSQAHKGSLQFPASYGFGQDFPLATKLP